MSGQQELWQAYDEQGEPVAGGSLTKAQAAAGALHGASHIWLWRRTDNGVIELLMQERAKDKMTWPGSLDVSAAGHIDVGETPLAAALRETKEELGLDVRDDDLTLLFMHRAHLVAPPIGKIENEFQMVYGAMLPTDQAMTFADREVSAVRWLSLAEYVDALDDPDKSAAASLHVVPHGSEYGAKLRQHIEQLAAAVQD